MEVEEASTINVSGQNDVPLPEPSGPQSSVESPPGTSTTASSPQHDHVEPGNTNPEQKVVPITEESTGLDATPSSGPVQSCETLAQESIEEETAEIYANVSSVVDSKLNQIEEVHTSIQSATTPSTASLKNNSLSLIMSYDDASDGSSDETEKEDKANNFSSLRYAPISSGCSSDDDQSSEEDNTDAGSSNDEHSDRDSDVEEVPQPAADTEKPTAAGQVAPKERKKNDLKDPLMLDLLPPIEKLSISVPEEDCVPVGKVYSIVDRLLVIESLPDTPPLMLDSVIFSREGLPLGQIFDIFGHVKRPFYSIRFNAPDDIKSLNVSIGRVVYCAPATDHTKYVFTYDLLREKGSDASWKHDEEPPPNCIDYSDDEAERVAKKGSKVKKEKEIDSPARRRHLSFEQLMNRNNTLRNRAFKRDSQGEARNLWDGGWHNYKKASAQLQQITSEPPPPPPPRQIQPCVYSNPAGVVNPMNIVIRPPCFNPVVDRPAVSFSPSPSGFTMTPPPWVRFEPPPTPPPRGFQYPSSPPSSGAFHRFDTIAPPPNWGIFPRFQPSPPSSGPFPQYVSPTQYGPSGFGPSFSSPPPPAMPMQPQSSSRYGPPNCPPSIPIPPPPFSANYSSYHPPKPNNTNNPNPLPPLIPRLPYSSNNNHPPLFNHPPF